MVSRLCSFGASLFVAIAVFLSLSLPAFSSAVVVYLDEYGAPYGVAMPGIDNPADALAALPYPPKNQRFTSALPAGTKVLSLTIEGNTTVVDFSKEIIGDELDDLRLENIHHQTTRTLAQYGMPAATRLLAEGRPLYKYLKPVGPIPLGPVPTSSSSSIVEHTATAAGTALLDKIISLSPGHGLYWNGSGWGNERPVYCAPLDREDYDNILLTRFLDTYLRQDGATIKNYRCLDLNYGSYPTGEPWWHMSGSYWLKHLGYPCEVYANSSKDCNLGSGSSESSDNIRSRPLASNVDNTDAHISVHTNGYQGDCYGSSCPNGTCTYYDSTGDHAPWGEVSQTLAQSVNSSIVNAIRTKYTDSTWRDRGALDAAGDYAETRIPERAAILIELAFHDSCDRDGMYLRDNFFRSTTMWAVYKGVCSYFGVTPTWDYYSYEIVSHDIPSNMLVNQTRTVHITLRNRGVLWTEAKQFRLGAVNDSDPFTTQTRHTIPGEVGPDQTITFTFDITAPNIAGTHRTDWRMVREAVTWFGPVVQQDIHVLDPAGDIIPPTVPTNLAATPVSQTQVNLTWSASTDNEEVAGYKIYRNNTYIASVTNPGYNDTGLTANTAYSYQVTAFDTVDNESAKCGAVVATTLPVLELIIDNRDAVFTGPWSRGTSLTGNPYGDDYHYGATAATENRTFAWTPSIQAPGLYDVFVWYPQGTTGRSVKAPYKVVYNGGSTTVAVDQNIGGGAWYKIATAKPFLPGTSGYVVLGNGTGETSKMIFADAVRFQYIAPLDTTPPVINSVDVLPSMVSTRDLVIVKVDASDNTGVIRVTANNAELLHTTANQWKGSIAAETGLVSHLVTVIASDAAGNASSDTSKSYTTTELYGLNNRSLLTDTALRFAAENRVFETWGKVYYLDTDHFGLTDGWLQRVNVYCPEHGLVTGNFVSVRGILDAEANPRVLNSQPHQIHKIID